MALKKRQKEILKALKDLGGEATIWQIAEKVNLNVNGVAQSLGAMYELVGLVSTDGITRWRLKE